MARPNLSIIAVIFDKVISSSTGRCSETKTQIRFDAYLTTKKK